VLEADEEVQVLISLLQVENRCTVNELAFADDDLAIYVDISEDQWEENFLAEIGLSSSKSPDGGDIGETSDVESESDEEYTDLPPTSLRCHNLHKAITCLNNFLEHKGHTCEATETISPISSLTMLHSVNLSKARRISLLEFFAGAS